MRKKEHFEVLLEDIRGDMKLGMEAVFANTEQLKRVDARIGAVEQRLERLEVQSVVTNQRLAKLEQGQQDIKDELGQVNCKLDALQETVEDHEIRIRQIEANG